MVVVVNPRKPHTKPGVPRVGLLKLLLTVIVAAGNKTASSRDDVSEGVCAIFDFKHRPIQPTLPDIGFDVVTMAERELQRTVDNGVPGRNHCCRSKAFAPATKCGVGAVNQIGLRTPDGHFCLVVRWTRCRNCRRDGIKVFRSIWANGAKDNTSVTYSSRYCRLAPLMFWVGAIDVRAPAIRRWY